MTIRTNGETKLLREEAERLARENWSRPDISRALNVPLHTLARWAFEGGWRAKDLAAEGEAERLAALSEQLAQQRAEHARSICGRSAGQIEYKSADFESAGPEVSGWPADEPVRWAAPEVRVKIPPWAPGSVYAAPEAASLWLAEDLMRQGLLVEAERALRFTKNWLKISRQVFDKQDEEDARRREYQQQQEQERQREKARCKALGLPDPDEVWAARSSSNNNSSSAANPDAAVPLVTDA